MAWGVLHGLLLIGHRLFRDFCSSRPGLSRWLQSSPGMLGRMALTFFCVSLGWVLFRATTFTAAATFIERLFVPNFGMDLPYSKQSLLVLTGVLMSCHLLAGTGWWKKLSERVPAPLMGTGYAVVLSLTLLIRPIAGQAFYLFSVLMVHLDDENFSNPKCTVLVGASSRDTRVRITGLYWHPAWPADDRRLGQHRRA